jgi:hypothetical protein
VAARILDRLGVDVGRVRQEVEQQAARGDSRLGVDMQLTARAKRVIDLAHEEARQLNNNYVGTEHLLLGLMADSDRIAGRVLARMGVTLESAREAVADIQESAPAPPASQGLDRLPGRLLDLLDRWLPDAAAEAAREKMSLEDVLRAEFDRVLRAFQLLRPEAFSDPSSVSPSPASAPESGALPELPPRSDAPRPGPPPSTEESRVCAIFKLAIHMARRLGSDDAFRVMLQDAIDALGDEDDDSPA